MVINPSIVTQMEYKYSILHVICYTKYIMFETSWYTR